MLEVASKVQVCPSSVAVVEVVCVLAEPGHVCQVLLTVSHGTDDVTSPVSFDLRVGHDLNDLHLVLEVLFLPPRFCNESRCPNFLQ